MIRRLLCLTLSLMPAAALAQNTPVVFVHGLNSDASTWQQAADYFGRSLAITPYLPDLSWSARYEDQARDLQQRFQSLPSSTIAVAHSNGGLVSRDWNRSHQLSGLVTVGTPHAGAPLVNNAPQFLAYMVNTLRATWTAAVSVGVLDGHTSGSWSWLSYEMAVYGGYGGQLLDGIVRGLPSEIWYGAETSAPVLPEMRPGSAFLQDINSGGNLAREGAAIPVRIGIVSRASRYGGPWRAFAPERAGDFGDLQRWLGYGLIASGFAVQNYADPDDPKTWDTASSLIDAGLYWLWIDGEWCAAVSAPFPYRGCTANDGIVPEYSQIYPGAVNFFVGDESGPAHTRETREVTPWIEDALVNYMQVPPAGSGPGDPPPPPPPSGGQSMTQNAGIRGCENYSDWGATYQPTADACAAYCGANGADACEWEASTGGCWVEFGDGCYVQPGFGGWWATTFSTPVPSATTSQAVPSSASKRR